MGVVCKPSHEDIRVKWCQMSKSVWFPFIAPVWAIIFMAIPALSSPAAWSVSPWYHLFVVDMTWKPHVSIWPLEKLSNSKEGDRREFYILMIAPFYPKYTPILPPSTALRSFWCSTMTVFQVLAQTRRLRTALHWREAGGRILRKQLILWRECLKNAVKMDKMD